MLSLKVLIVRSEVVTDYRVRGEPRAERRAIDPGLG